MVDTNIIKYGLTTETEKYITEYMIRIFKIAKLDIQKDCKTSVKANKYIVVDNV